MRKMNVFWSHDMASRFMKQADKQGCWVTKEVLRQASLLGIERTCCQDPVGGGE
jgi:hypothetical protein